jgi:hypothetical protein
MIYSVLMAFSASLERSVYHSVRIPRTRKDTRKTVNLTSWGCFSRKRAVTISFFPAGNVLYLLRVDLRCYLGLRFLHLSA